MTYYRYTFLHVEECKERVYYDLTPERIWEIMQNPDIILSSVEKVDKAE